jgi:asparagine synthase (glutamine-hydrolysing)
MCGIAGLWNLNGKAAEAHALSRMIQMIRHRGPDDCGIHTDGSVGLAHARLSIIDLTGGRQPMSACDGDVWITFNGEIFNYVELREKLIGKGFRFHTSSDTEVILQNYLFKGEDCIEDFEGQWAFAIWDSRKRRLLLSRDRLGVRPLFYWHQHDTFLFASEMKALLANPIVRRELDPAALDQIFTYWCAIAPRTIFKDVRELPPGHNLTISRGSVMQRRYWQLDYGEDSRTGSLKQKLAGQSERQLCEELTHLLTDATRLRLRADVPVGAYLSGGLDSSVVTALVRKFTRAPIETFSVAFDNPEYDETQHQKTVSRFLNLERNAVPCTPHGIGKVFPEVIWHTEQPILRTAPAPLFLLARRVRERGYKVVLAGEGADEMFGGYDIFKEAKIRLFCAAQPNSRLRPRLLSRLYPYLPNLQLQSTEYLKTFFRVSETDTSSPLFSHLPRWGLTSKLKEYFTTELREQMQPAEHMAELRSLLPSDFERWQPFHKAQYLEASLLMPGYILSSQGDRMAMAHGVECRFPFLDSRVVEFAAALPLPLKMRVLNEKYILKQSAKELIPDSVRNRHKQPYRAPDGASFLGNEPEMEYVEELLGNDQIRANRLFKPRSVENLLAKFRRGQAIGVKDNMALVGILSTQLVMTQFIQQLGGRNEASVAQVHH